MLITIENTTYDITNHDTLRRLLSNKPQLSDQIIQSIIADPDALKDIVGKDKYDLIFFMRVIPEQHQVALLNALINKNIFFKDYITSSFDLSSCFSHFSINLNKLIVTHLLNHPNIFHQLISTGHHLSFLLKDSNELYAQMIIDHLINHPDIIRQLCTNSVSLIHTLDSTPEKIAIQLFNTILSNPDMLNYYFAAPFDF